MAPVSTDRAVCCQISQHQQSPAQLSPNDERGGWKLLCAVARGCCCDRPEFIIPKREDADQARSISLFIRPTNGQPAPNALLFTRCACIKSTKPYKYTQKRPRSSPHHASEPATTAQRPAEEERPARALVHRDPHPQSGHLPPAERVLRLRPHLRLRQPPLRRHRYRQEE